ncbi:MAG: sigma-70 family RNA polymerase sigma factor [Planctomycetota bacterium]
MDDSAGTSPSPADLIHSCQGLVRSIAWKIHQRLPRRIELDDLIGYGQVGLAEAARDFNLTRGVQFTTYAYYRVRGAVLDGLGTMAWFSKADYSHGRYEQAANAVLCESATEEGIGGELSWFVSTTRSLSAAFLISDYASACIENQNSDVVSPSSAAEADDLKRIIDQALDRLTEQERTLVKGIYFQGLSIKDAGEHIGISKAWASRLHARILQNLGLQLSSCSP